MAARLRRLVLVVVIALLAAPVAKATYPSSMASTGDSITRAFNTGYFPFLDAPANSWSTGTSSYVWSHYRRILSVNPSIYGRNYNDAVSGADMADLNGQVTRAVAQGVDYVTILMGANDVCASSEAAMTPVADFRAQFQTAMSTLTSGLPSARIYVVSVPDVYRLWYLFRFNLSALFIWDVADICQSMLANPLSYSSTDIQRRYRVRQRNIDYNTQLAQVCSQYANCRFDGNAIFNYPFQTYHVSTRDYFHPSLDGQRAIAAVSWAAGFSF